MFINIWFDIFFQKYTRCIFWNISSNKLFEVYTAVNYTCQFTMQYFGYEGHLYTLFVSYLLRISLSVNTRTCLAII